MSLRDSMMGKAGHALELHVENLFVYNGFQTEMNKQTRVGEVDVVVRFGNFDAYVECKEYNPRSTAQVTRDMISNISKKAELSGVKNAVLVTTKPPSTELQGFAREAGVILRTHEDVELIKTELLRIADLKMKPLHLVKRFNLVNNADDASVRRRREFLRSLVAGKIDARQAISEVSSGKNAVRIWGAAALLVAVIVACAFFFPAFRSFLITVAVVAVIGVYAINQFRQPKRRRRKAA